MTNDATTDTAALLRLLQDEVEQLRGSDRAKEEEIERQGRDAKRTMVMLQLTHDQLRLLKDANVKLETQLVDAGVKIRKLESIAQDREEEALHASKLLSDCASAHQDRVSKLEAQIRMWTQKTDAQSKANDVVRKELNAMKERLEDAEAAKEKESRAAFEIRTAIEVRLKHRTTELEDLNLLRDKEAKEVTSREYELSKTIADLKRTAATSAERFERDRRADFSLVSALKTENETMNLRVAQLERSLSESESGNGARVERLKIECNQYRERLEEAIAAHGARERSLETQVAKLCADLRVAQSEINAMADGGHALRKEHADALITMNARNDVAKLRIEDLEGELKSTKDKLRATIVEHAAQLDQLKLDQATAMKVQQDATIQKSQALQHTSMDLRVAESRLSSVEDELHRQMERAAREGAQQANELMALKAELEGYRNAVAKLEQHIENNFEVQILTEQNVALREEVDQLKDRVRHANQTLANLRVEADISEGYRVKLLQDELEGEIRRSAAIEKERRSGRTLLDALASSAKKHKTLDSSLASEVDHFYRTFGAVSV